MTIQSILKEPEVDSGY